ncbi:MAG: hypothetical protein QOI88_888 [Gammaproteobacteria bacterium]|nr:hypothetical protein [Gammaproteobacteria bacterium]
MIAAGYVEVGVSLAPHWRWDRMTDPIAYTVLIDQLAACRYDRKSQIALTPNASTPNCHLEDDRRIEPHLKGGFSPLWC